MALLVRGPADNEEGKKLFKTTREIYIDVMATTFSRIGSHRYCRPDEGEDAPTHAIEILRGADGGWANVPAIRCLWPAFLQWRRHGRARICLGC